MKYRLEEFPFEFIDHDTGKYEVVYTPDEGEYKIEVWLKGDNEKEYKIRGTPFIYAFLFN